MQEDSIIANTISDDIRQKGHQSIRFTADGFSILISDASFVPVYLKKFRFPDPPSDSVIADECMRLLKEEHLVPFEGETVFISDSLPATIVPVPFFDEAHRETILSTGYTLSPDELVLDRKLKNRPEHIVYSFSKHFQKLELFYSGGIRVLHSGECLISLSDQVSASDHQRGFMLVEIQEQRLEILVIRGDSILLLNRYRLKNPSDFIYHIINTMKQLNLDREKVPVYYAGMFSPDTEPNQILGRYIRRVLPVPYFLEGVDKLQKLEFLLLSEATKCA